MAAAAPKRDGDDHNDDKRYDELGWKYEYDNADGVEDDTSNRTIVMIRATIMMFI